MSIEEAHRYQNGRKCEPDVSQESSERELGSLPVRISLRMRAILDEWEHSYDLPQKRPNTRRSFDDDLIDDVAPSRQKQSHERARERRSRLETKHGGFLCTNSDCKQWIPICDSMGTKNRNHCPGCLASKHLDEERPGDRLSTCGARMDAIGLTLKNESSNQYASTAFHEHSGGPRQGELMIVHRCSGCGVDRINRIAADDNVHSILALYEQSLQLPSEIQYQLATIGIQIVGPYGRAVVTEQLFGKPVG